jgi:hypothetical protein
MLPILQGLLARWPVGCAEYKDVQRAICRLESRLHGGEQVDVCESSGILRDYL